MFDPEGPPLQWDGAGAYVRDRVELYYLAHAGRPLTRVRAGMRDALTGENICAISTHVQYLSLNDGE